MRLIYQCQLCAARNEIFRSGNGNGFHEAALEMSYSGQNAHALYVHPNTLHPCNLRQTGVAILIGAIDD